MSVSALSIINFNYAVSFISSFILLHIISSYILHFFSLFFSIGFVCFPPFLLFLFPFWFPFLFSSVSSFVSASFSVSSTSFPFPFFLFFRYLYPLFVSLFPRFSSLFFSAPPCRCFFSSFGFSCSASPLLSPLFPLLICSIFSLFYPYPSLSFGFPPTSAFLLLFLFSLLLFSSLSSLSSAPLPSSSSASWILSFFVFSSSVGSFFLPFSFPFLASSFPCLFLLLRSLFSCSLSFFPFGFSSLSFAMYSFAYRLLVAFLSSVVSFPFLFFLHFQLYSSAVSYLFRPPYCIPPRFFFLPCAVRSIMTFPPSCPPPPPSSALSDGSFALFRPSSCSCGSVFVSFLSFVPVFLRIVCFAFFLYRSLALAGFSLSLSLESLSSVGIPAPGLPLRLLSPSFVIFCSAAPASFSLSWRGGGGGQLVLFLLPECMLFLSLCLAGGSSSLFILTVVFVCSSSFLSLLHCPGWSCSYSLLPFRLSSCSLCRFSLLSARDSCFPWLSCLSLVVVLCASGSFFTLWVSFIWRKL